MLREKSRFGLKLSKENNPLGKQKIFNLDFVEV